MPESSAGTQARVENLHPVTDRPLRAARKMTEAANVGGRDQVRLRCFERLELVDPELLRQHWLQDRIGARGAAAEVPIRDRRELQPDRLENFLDPPIELLAVLQGAW